VIIQINKTIVELTCAPTTEVACKLELGPLELFISSILKKTKANSTVLLNNATLNLSIILFKVYIPAATLIDTRHVDISPAVPRGQCGLEGEQHSGQHRAGLWHQN
jgi:hypothetical protein